MIDRRAFVSTMTLALLLATAPLAAKAQPAGKVWRIGYVTSQSAASAGCQRRHRC